MRVLEIGPAKGKRQHPGWKTLNCIKGPQTDYVADITRPMKIKERFDLIYMSHVLEHIPWWMNVATLQNIRALLVSGGAIEIWVPDFEKILEVYRGEKDMSVDKFSYLGANKDRMRWVQGRIFAGFTKQPKIYTNISVWHKSLYDEKSLSDCLIKAGFKDPVRIEKPRGYDHGFINLGMMATN